MACRCFFFSIIPQKCVKIKRGVQEVRKKLSESRRASVRYASHARIPSAIACASC